MVPEAPTATGDVPAKATLFCRRCGHQSRYDGDWRLSTRARWTSYHCPDCGTEITVRPADGDGAGRGRTADLWRFPFRAWVAGVRAWMAMWPRSPAGRATVH